MGANENAIFYTSQDPYEFFKDLAAQDPRVAFLLRAFEDELEPEGKSYDELLDLVDEQAEEIKELERRLQRLGARNQYLELKHERTLAPYPWCYLRDLQNDVYDFTDSQSEIDSFAVDHGFDEKEITGVVFELVDGEIEQLWITEDSRPYDLSARYDRWI